MLSTLGTTMRGYPWWRKPQAAYTRRNPAAYAAQAECVSCHTVLPIASTPSQQRCRCTWRYGTRGPMPHPTRPHPHLHAAWPARTFDHCSMNAEYAAPMMGPQPSFPVWYSFLGLDEAVVPQAGEGLRERVVRACEFVSVGCEKYTLCVCVCVHQATQAHTCGRPVGHAPPRALVSGSGRCAMPCATRQARAPCAKR